MNMHMSRHSDLCTSRSSRVVFLCSVVASLVFAGQALAQSCTGTSADDLLSCQHSAVEECRTANSCADDRNQALTAQDVVESAASQCCSRTGRRRRACLSNFNRLLANARRVAPRAIKRFLGTARGRVATLRSNGCDTGSMGDS